MKQTGDRSARSRNAGTGRREELLQVATQVFARTGFAASTVREIGEEAGILSGSLYHHFESKDAMLEEILRPFTVKLVEAYSAIAASPMRAADQMRQLIKTAYGVVADEANVVTILQNEAAFLWSQERYRFIVESDRHIRASWIEVIERGQADGDFRADLEPRLVYRALMGSTLAAVRWFHPHGPHDVDRLADHQTRLFLDGLQVPSRMSGESPIVRTD